MKNNSSLEKKIKILIAGIGGVGGYFGGLLAREFENNKSIEVFFLARGKHLDQIKIKGLSVAENKGTFIAYPKLATDNAIEIGEVDYVIICTKTYDLESVCQQLKPNISEKTIILSLLNGVNNHKIIEAFFPNTLIANGCVYLVSCISKPGLIEKSGNIESLFFGLDNKSETKLEQLNTLLQQAKIQSTLSTNISSIIWEKFIFLSSIATATSYFDCNIGEILNNQNKGKILERLVEEAIEIAHFKNVAIAENIFEKTMTKFSLLPAEITSSLHRDFQNKKPKTELEALTGFLVNEANLLGIKTPVFSKMFQNLKNK